MLYDKVIKILRQRKIPVSQLEKKCGLANGTIRKWNEANPKIESVAKVANELGVSVDELLKE